MYSGNVRRGWFAVSGAVVVMLAILLGTLSPIQAQKGKEKEKENFPHMHAAIKELRDAKKELEKAAHDFNGRRVEAIRACDVAINELETALKFANK
jgi:hypothetical protein